MIARGAGLPDQALSRRDPSQTLTEIGEVLRVMTENMMRLLAARSESKRAIRSTDHTMMGATDNNPLKFSPTVEDALTIVLGPPMRSYLSGSDAVSEGFDDLVNHQMRTFAAMQQAMKMLLEDLDPALIDKSVEEDRGVASFLGSRKTKLWDQYVTRWQAKAGRNDNGMAGVFMLYFAECYDRLGDRDR
jgi:type VI secretion system protein ImpI